MHANNQSEFVHGFDNALVRDDEYDALVRDDGYDKAKHEFRRLSRNGWLARLLPLASIASSAEFPGSTLSSPLELLHVAGQSC
jgi:hypothetical protein